MGLLNSTLFTAEDIDGQTKQRLEDCAAGGNESVTHIAHGQRGEHVRRVQEALARVVQKDPGLTDPQRGAPVPAFTVTGDYAAGNFPRAVAAYKARRKISNFRGQIDDIVGKGTIRQLDLELNGQPQPRPPLETPTDEEFVFRLPSGSLLIKKGVDSFPPANQDLENAPVNRPGAKARAETFASGGLLLNEAQARKNLLTVAGTAGPESRELAEFFTRNTQPPARSPGGFTRHLGNGDFWEKRIAADRSFLDNHQGLSKAIEITMSRLATVSEDRPRVVDVNDLEFQQDGSQPQPLEGKQTKIDFSFQRDRSRLTARDPLTFGIGSIQGVEISIVGFNGRRNGSYNGVLKYVLIDHYGSNDSDVIDAGQGSLWLLQRKMVPGQSKNGFEPYRSDFTVKVPFFGKLRVGPQVFEEDVD